MRRQPSHLVYVIIYIFINAVGGLMIYRTQDVSKKKVCVPSVMQHRLMFPHKNISIQHLWCHFSEILVYFGE